MRKQKPIIIKSYDKDRQFQRDATKMAKRGYEVHTVSKQRKRSSLGRIIMTGGLGLVARGQEFVVTYRLILA